MCGYIISLNLSARDISCLIKTITSAFACGKMVDQFTRITFSSLVLQTLESYKIFPILPTLPKSSLCTFRYLNACAET